MKTLFAFLSGALAVLLLTMIAASGPTPETSVYFSPSGNERLLQKSIAAELIQAKKSISVAMYHFTSTALAKTLATAKNERGVGVRLLLDKRQFESSQSTSANAIEILRKGGVEFKMIDLMLPGAEPEETPRFHHKFCVIDESSVITGSYNWTNMGDRSNHENIVILRNPETAKQYLDLFNRIWKETK